MKAYADDDMVCQLAECWVNLFSVIPSPCEVIDGRRSMAGDTRRVFIRWRSWEEILPLMPF